MFFLNSKIAIYVPTTIHVNQPVDTSEYVSLVQAKLGRWFGGTTTLEAFGGYMSSENEHIGEPIYIVRSHCTTEQLEEHFSDVVALGEWLREELDQESITGELNDAIFFMDGT